MNQKNRAKLVLLIGMTIFGALIGPALHARPASDAKKQFYKDRISRITEKINRDKKNYRAYHIRGIYYRRLGKYKKALDDFKTALQLKPGSAKLHNSRGIVYMRLKKYSLALKEYNTALKLRPGNAGVYNNRGNLYRARKKYAKAVKDYDAALKLRPKYRKALYNRALVYALRKDCRALADYKSASRMTGRTNSKASIQRLNRLIAGMSAKCKKEKKGGPLLGR